MRVEDPRDSTKRYFRSNKRVFVLNGQWFYSTREGERGPFPTQKRAEEELERFKAEMSDLQRFQKNRETAKVESARHLHGVPTIERGRVIRPRREPVSQNKLRELLI
jgi:hypothetical protein